MHQQSNLLVVIIALAFSVLGVSGAMGSVIKAIMIIYRIKDARPFIQQQVLSVGLTVGLIAAMAFILPLLFIGPNVLIAWNVPGVVIAAFSVVRWLILLAIAIVGLGVVYHFALPDNRTWQWFGWGSLIATALWLIITAGFFVYLQYFANFSTSYSFFAGIIALMIWLNFSAFTILVGAYVNRECEA
jgi:membrane protein